MIQNNFLSIKNISGLSCLTNELEEELNIYLKLFVLLYTDDTVLFSETKEGLQLRLDYFSEYCQTWKLKVNRQDKNSHLWQSIHK